MDAESRAFYAVGLSALILVALGLLIRALGATLPTSVVVVLLVFFVGGITAIVFGQRRLPARWRAWRASRPPSWPAGWKMPPRDR